MTKHIIVSLGQLIKTDFNNMVNALTIEIIKSQEAQSISIEKSAVLTKDKDNNTIIKPEKLTSFLNNLVAKFRVNGFFSAKDLPVNPERSREQAQQEINQKNSHMFREATRALFELSTDDLPDNKFDEMWCAMCVVEKGHAQRFEELLSYSHARAVFHSGTNVIQAEHIRSKLKDFGVTIPAECLFLSYEQEREYKRVADPAYTKVLICNQFPQEDERNKDTLYLKKNDNNLEYLSKQGKIKTATLESKWPEQIKTAEQGSVITDTKMVNQIAVLCGFIQPNLMHSIYAGLNLQLEDHIYLMQGTKDRIPEAFMPVALQRYDDSSHTLYELWENTTVIIWDNLAKDINGELFSLVRYLQQNYALENLLAPPPVNLEASKTPQDSIPEIPNLQYYPGLENSFNAVKDLIKVPFSFSDIKVQMDWAFNNYEQQRTLHRLHCLFNWFLGRPSNLFIDKLSPAEKQALIALTLLDGCKNSAKSQAAFREANQEPLKDGVPSFFKMMKVAPQIFPIYNKLSSLAQNAIQENFFYLHLRALRLGEIPSFAVDKELLKRPLHLMVAFWCVNEAGFDLLKKPHYPLGENTGPTVTAKQEQQFKELVEALENQDLLAYYIRNSVLEENPQLKQSLNLRKQDLVSRLGKMLDIIEIAENDSRFLDFVNKNVSLMDEVIKLEYNIFTEYALEAISFLPALLETLHKTVVSTKDLATVLNIFLCLQKQLYASLPNFIMTLGENRTVPLFNVANNQHDMLMLFASAADNSQFHFEAAMNDKFITLKLVDGPVPSPTETDRKELSANKPESLNPASAVVG